MKRKKVVAGNWKMNMNLEESKKLISELMQINVENVDVKIAPSFTNLFHSNIMLDSSSIEVISQDMYHEQKGPFTGEISAEMLLGIGIKTSIIGHSERRKYFGETDLILSKKVNSAIENKMKIVFCIGEELTDRNNNNHFDIIESQLRNGIFHIESSQFKNIIIAYEPVWAIGTGMTANSDQIQEMHQFIRGLVNSKYGNEISQNIKILYGGSVKPSNAKEIFSLKDIDGGLIGGASLNFSDFNSIVEAANE
jgi:triosephosphate isomerase